MACRSAVLHVLFRFIFVAALLFVCMPHSSDGAGDAEFEETLRCALQGKFVEKCNIGGGPLKPHFVELMKRSSGLFISVLRGQPVDVDPNVVVTVPHALIFLLPPEVWSRFSPQVVSQLVKWHKTNEAVVKSVTRGYAKASRADREAFLYSMDFGAMDHSVISLIASEVSSNWTIDGDQLIEFCSSTFLVALPEAHVLKMDKKQQGAMLDKVVRWDNYGLDREKWFSLPATTKRIWAIISRNYSYRGEEQITITPLLAGATPSELQQDGKLFSEYELLKLPLKNRLQVRALFPHVRQDQETLDENDLRLVNDWVLFLSPDQINRFRHGVDFMYTVKEKRQEYWSYPRHQKPFFAPSLPTLRQIIEITTMVSSERGELPLNSEAWTNEISVFGPLAFLIGARRLGKLGSNTALDWHTLKEIDSYCFSKRMARHLMFNRKDILKVRGLLRGVPTGNLLSSHGTDINGMDAVHEIVQNIPADEPARTALVFRKVREHLRVFIYLEAILRNPYPEQFASLLTFNESRDLYRSLFQHWTRVQAENLVDKIYLLPDSVLSNLLSSPKKLGMASNLSSHLESKCLGGLTCERLLAVEISSIPETVSAMRHARKRAGKTDMSKKVQRCARIALDRYLIERASSTYASRKEAMASTVTAINPVDIVNFGGFVLATFPPAEIRQNRFAKEIMKQIGTLSAYELVSAIPCYRCLREMAEAAADVIGGRGNLTLSHLLDLGSLVGYLPPSLIGVIHPAHWRITAEAASLDGSSYPLCIDDRSRNAWETVIRAAFGAPEHWTADTLASIGGYMPALRETTLQAVSLDERTAAGDTIGVTSGSPYLHGVDIVGYDHPRAFWKVCGDLLNPSDRKDYERSLWGAARFQLNSAQLSANKVKSADVLKEQKMKESRTSLKSANAATAVPPNLTSPPSSVWSWRRYDEKWGSQESTAQNLEAKMPVFGLPPNTNNQDVNSPWTITPPASGSVVDEGRKENSEPAPLKPSEDKGFTSRTQLETDVKLPKPSEDKKLELSPDLDDFISQMFPSTGLLGTESTPAVTEDVTETPATEESMTSVDMEITEASIAFLQGQDLLNKQSDVNTSSQVYVPEDQNIESLDVSDDFENKSPELNMRISDLKLHTALPSTPKPFKITNGTVFGLPNISIPVESTSDEPVTVSPPFEGDVITVISASPIELSNKNHPSENFNKPATDSLQSVGRPYTSLESAGRSSASLLLAERPDASLPLSGRPNATLQSTEGPDASLLSAERSSKSSFSPKTNPISAAPNSSTTGTTRRRRNVAVEAFEVPLTCDGLQTMGPAAALALSLSDVDMAYEELEDCVEFIGKLDLPKEVAKAFWKKLKMATRWDTIGDVGCLVAGMSKDEVPNLKLDTKGEHFLDTLSAISSYGDTDVRRLVILKLKSRLDEEIASDKTVALAEEIALALGPNVCLLAEDIRSHLVNTPNVLLRSLSGINRDEFYERSACQPQCLRALLGAFVNQTQIREWSSEDIRNAGVLVAGLPANELDRMSTESPLVFAEMTAGAARCLSGSQLKAMLSESSYILSPIAAGALSEDQLRVFPEQQRSALKIAVLGRSGIDSSQEVLIGSAAHRTPCWAPSTILAYVLVKYFLL